MFLYKFRGLCRLQNVCKTTAISVLEEKPTPFSAVTQYWPVPCPDAISRGAHSLKLIGIIRDYWKDVAQIRSIGRLTKWKRSFVNESELRHI